MASSVIMGLLSGLGNLGEQRAEARQYSADEIIRRLAQQQEIEEHKLRTKQTQQQMLEEPLRMDVLRQQVATGSQPQMIGTPYIRGGKQYARFRSPMNGQMTEQELPGAAPDPPEKQMYDALIALNFTPEEAKQEVSRKYGGRPSTAVGPHGIEPDPNNPGMGLLTYYDPITHEPYLQIPTMLPMGFDPTYSQTTGKDIWGNDRSATTIHGRTVPGQAPPRFQAPNVPFGASGGVSAPTPARPTQTPQITPTGPQAAASPATSPTGLVPPLDQQGNIPMQAGFTPGVVALANQVRRNPAIKIPPAAQGKVGELINKYDPNWTPETKLPAASIQTIEQLTPVLDQVNSLRADIERLRLTKNNTSAYLLKDYLRYKAGKAAQAGTLGADIAGFSLGSLVEAASVLKGTSRSMPALDIAMQHTPNVVIDSPQNIYDKLGFIKQRLVDAITVAKDPNSYMSADGTAKYVSPPANNNPLGLVLPGVP